MKKYFFFAAFLYLILGGLNIRAQSIPAYIPVSGLKSLYLFSGNVADSSGYGADGTIFGSVTFGTDRFGVPNHCYVGTGYSGLQIPYTNLPVGNHARAASCWFKSVLPYPGSLMQMIAWGDNSAIGNRFGMFCSDTSVGFESVGTCKATHWVVDSAWHNLIINYPLPCEGTNTMEVYLDGNLAVTFVVDPLAVLTTDTGYIHTIGTLFLPPYGYYSWHGKLDEAAIWDRSLTPCEIWQVSHSAIMPSGGPISGPDSVCIGSTITLTDTATGGIWVATNSRALISGGGVVTGLVSGPDTFYHITSTVCDTTAFYKIVLVSSGVPVAPIVGIDTFCFPVEMPSVYTDATPGGVWSCSNSTATVSATGELILNTIGSDTLRYTVSGGCSVGYAGMVITILPYPTIDSIGGPGFICQGATALYTDSTAGGVWSSGVGTTISTSGVVAGILPGYDTIYYQVSNFCGDAVASKVISVYTLYQCDSVLAVTSVLPIAQKPVAFPNPASNEVRLTTAVGNEITGVRLVNQLGQECRRWEGCSSEAELVTGGLPDGYYVLVVVTPGGNYYLPLAIMNR